jgi:DNA-binding winged helix-turn-helix (wHTH) protein/tetratricopeptide (TPR) repeat protein
VKLGFAGFVLDREAGRLTGPEGEVRLRPQAFRMLEALIGQAPRIVSQEELIERVWGVEHLSPASVKQAVSEVRQALGDDPGRPEIIETVPRRGYRFIAPLREIVETPVEPAPPPAAPAPPKPPELSTRPIAVQSPPARRPASRLAAAAAVPLLAGLSALALVQRPSPPPKPPARAAATVAARPAVAVLGFQNLSGDPKEDWISGALAEILGFELAAPGKIRLIPAEEVARMRRELPLPSAESHSRLTLADVRRDLGADLVVSGSYLLAEPGKLRLQVLAQDARTGETVAWTRQTGTPEELIELATAAARGLQATIAGGAGGASGAPAEAAAFASSTESLRLYSEAVSRLRVWDAAAALPLLDRAAGIDPANPFVRDALADAYTQLGFDSRAKETALKALEISGGLPPEIRGRIEGRAREVRNEWEEAVRIYGDLQRRHPDDLEVGLRLAGSQRGAGHADRSLASLTALRRLPPPAGDDPRIDLAEAAAAFQLGDFARGRDAASRAIAGAGRRGALVLVAEGLTERGWNLHRLGREEAALADHRAARALFEKTGDRGGGAAAQVASAAVLQTTGRTAEARQAYEAAIPVLREIGDRRREAKALNNLASLLGDLGDLDGVASLLERSLAIKRETGDLAGLATSLANLGNLLRSRGETGAARARLEEALKIHRGLKNDFGTAFALRGLARVAVREKRPAEALASLEEALALSRKTGDAEGAAEALLALGDLTRAMGRTERARQCYGQAFEEFRRLDQVSSMVYPLLNLADMDQEQKRFTDARARYDQALPLALKAESPFLEAHVRTGLAWTAEHQGDLGRARSERERALALWTRLGDKEQAAKVRAALEKMGA